MSDPHRLPVRQVRQVQASDADGSEHHRVGLRPVSDGHPPPGRLLLLRPAGPNGNGHGNRIQFEPDMNRSKLNGFH